MIGNAPAFSVSDFVAVFNQSIDMLYPEVVITGELANFRISKNMWTYFDLKDDMASVKFFGSVRSLPGPLEDGMLLEVAGRPYLHPQFGFSIQVVSVQAVGAGAINKAFLLLQKKLESEGLFDPARKRKLPFAPEKVGLIASKESAGYGDFMKILNRRWPATEVRLFDVQVQGRSAPEQIVSAIDNANKSQQEMEVLVIVRGGGSKDDLAAFDHEAVVRAIAASRIPTLVAIGHDRDEALGEMAADMRASTPSNAAEILVPDRQNELAELNANVLFLGSLVARFSDRLNREVAEYQDALERIIQSFYDNSLQYLKYSSQLIQAYDPRLPLGKGYSLVCDTTGKIITSAVDAKKAGMLNLEFKDGYINAEVRK